VIRLGANSAVFWTLFAAAIAPSTVDAQRPVAVRVDCDQVHDGEPQLWGHVNVSRRAPPPVEFCSKVEVEFGRPKITRCWLMLDQMWDYRTDTYRFDYEINRDYYTGDPNKKRYGVTGETTGLHYHDYIDSVSAHSEAVLLNIRRYEQEVLTGMLTLEQWKEVFKNGVRHYKLRCPNLRYIEVLNEPKAKNQSNLGHFRHYYKFYRCTYQAINELNAELEPELPLLVGGPSGFRTKEALELIDVYARDEAPDKKLDFLSFHHYWVNSPAEIAGWEAVIDEALEEASLPTDLPIFVTEIGYVYKWREDPARNLWQAAGMTAFQYFARHAPDLRLFPWVQYHSWQQIGFVQFDPELRMTPYGAAVKMLLMHGDRELHATSSQLEEDGNGVGVLATRDDQGLCVQLWRLAPNRKRNLRADVAVVNVPNWLRSGSVTVRRYLIDSSHSNCLTAPGGTTGLELVEGQMIEGAAELKFSAELEPISLCLWRIDRTDERQK
jgi:hypothetical protein